MALSETRIHRGLLWPRPDERCANYVWRRLPDLRAALEFVKGRKICVQAGGNMGVWPRYLAKRFDTVYTFEADPLNFRCLCANVPHQNVFKFNAAVGFDRGCVDMHRTLNCGAHKVSGAGVIPMLRIDDLELPGCDFLQLDIEGYEHQALLGAAGLIEKHRPVVMIESKTTGGRKRYGAARKMLEDMGAKLVMNVNSDWVYAW